MSDNPFSEPDDNEKTIVRLPGHKMQPPPAAAPPGAFAPQSDAPRTAADDTVASFAAGPAGDAAAAFANARTPPFAAAGRLPEAELREPVTIARVGRSALMVAAGPLLDLVVLLGSGSGLQWQGNPSQLRDRALQALQTFEAEGRAAQVPEDVLRGAHYALCATIDDLALSSHWASASDWAARSLSSVLHQDVRSGQGFFDQLARMQQDPGRFLPALEICYFCLSLGMRGRYRVDARGRDELESIREGLYQLLMRLTPAAEPALSVHWRGVDAPHLPPGRQVPVWVPPAIAAGILALSWLLFSTWINGRGDDLQGSLAALPPPLATVIQREAPVVPAASVVSHNETLEFLQGLLQREVEQHLVTLEGDQQHVLIRLAGSQMFDSGSADILPTYLDLLQRIGQALRDRAGLVQVIGHTDDQPIRTVRFPSNQALSLARAGSARAVLVAAAGGDAGRFSAEGRADTEPLQPNSSPEGRLLNRRIEIILRSAEGR